MLLLPAPGATKPHGPWQDREIDVAIPLFPRFTALDGIGPYEVLQRIPLIDVTFVGHERGVVRSDNGFLGIEVDATFDELDEPDVVVFPGGIGTRALLDDDRVLDWLRHAHAALDVHDVGVQRIAGARRRRAARRTRRRRRTGASSTCSVGFGAVPTGQRVVEHLDHRIITAAGVSSGIDMALRLAELLVDRTAAEAAQLEIEYDPQPPFDAGALHKASAEVRQRLAEYATVRQCRILAARRWRCHDGGHARRRDLGRRPNWGRRLTIGVVVVAGRPRATSFAAAA